MLGVTSQDTRSDYLRPDGHSPPEEVYRRFVLWEVFSNQSLRVLGCSSDKAGSEFRAPSWVPDFKNLDPHHSLVRWEGRASFSASAETPVRARLSDDGAVLHLGGRIVDRVHTIGQESVVVLDPDKWAKKHPNKPPQWYQVFRAQRRMTREALSISQAATKRAAPTGGVLPGQKEHQDWAMITEGRHGVPAHVKPFLQALVCKRTDYGQVASASFLAMVAAYVGIVLDGPKRAKVGDMVVVLHLPLFLTRPRRVLCIT